MLFRLAINPCRPNTYSPFALSHTIPTMKQTRLLVVSILYALLLCLGLVLPALSQIPARPQPPKAVNDLANVIPDGQEQLLEQKLRRYNDSTSTQVVVVTVNSLNGDEAYQFAYEVGQQWGVGKDNKDNGAVILVAPNERKTFIAVGYGLEPTLTDALSKRITDTYLLPNFKQNKFYEGVDQALDAIFKVLTGQFSKDNSAADTGHRDLIIFLVFLFFVLFFVFVLPAILNKSGYDDRDNDPNNPNKNQPRGRGYTYNRRGSWGGPVIITNSGGGWGDFSSGSGGFGGFDFGGGDFGGGGAGGDW